MCWDSDLKQAMIIISFSLLEVTQKMKTYGDWHSNYYFLFLHVLLLLLLLLLFSYFFWNHNSLLVFRVQVTDQALIHYFAKNFWTIWPVLSITGFYIEIYGPALRLSSFKLPCNLFAIIHIVENNSNYYYYYYYYYCCCCCCCCFVVYINIYLNLWNFSHLYGKSYFTFQSVSVRLKFWVRDWKKCKEAM